MLMAMYMRRVGADATYSERLQKMVSVWRADWGDTDARLPFYQVEIAPYNYGDGPDGALLRRAQHDAAKRMPPALRRAHLGEERKSELSHEAEGAAERMVNHLLHGMRGCMDDDTFRKCLNAMEEVLETSDVFTSAL